MNPWSLAAVALALVAFIGVVWLAAVVAWGERRTRGLAYFGLPRRDRERFRRRLRAHARALAPVIRLTALVSPFRFDRASFEYRGVSGPKGTCTPGSFRSGADHRPAPEDVFVVAQMRSGTTWMQHLVYEILMRGTGDLVENGRTLNAVSPWLESEIGVPVAEAPRLGRERRSRVIKTHFPVSLCPYSRRARYIYVVRDPVSCFASCRDFLADNLGAAAPPIDALERWFCSDERMWWGGWPSHVGGWWSRSRREENVFFVRFETMLASLPDVVAGVASFLGVTPLSPAEMEAVSTRAGFDYMKRHKEAFEMYPPHVLAPDSAYFSRGTADRHRDVPEAVRRRILAWCRAELEGSPLPFGVLLSEGDRPSEGGDSAPRAAAGVQ